MGLAPASAAAKVGITRETAYAWKQKDKEFDARWKDAIEAGLDRMETAVYGEGFKGNITAAIFVLKHKRKEIYGDFETEQPQQTAKQLNNYFLNITLQEHAKRIERLGFQAPLIESDFEDEDEREVSG